ncbi:biotin/lipoyl-containing protein [Microbacterium sp. NPDC096154]|uniref:biotin/lipoyl-containing protein n=1 Tax=Microbacterium sp. NPDC096154 TaxID=3155549 RepID=UPI00331CDB34
MNSNVISSPAPGIFWHRRSPEAEPFLAPGQEVRQGQPIGVIEVMKMFVEVNADRDGVFKAYAVDNGASVPMGAALVELEEA